MEMMTTTAEQDSASQDAVHPPALEARDLYRFYRTGDEETLALKGVSLTLAPGEVVAVVGPSGSGKSTLLNMLAGLDEPSGGSVWVAGQRISHQTEAVRAQLRSRHIGVLRQSDNLLPHLSVQANLELVAALRRNQADPHALLTSLGIADRAPALPHQLSGGETARAGLALALVNSPEVLLCDEPTGELDGDSEGSLLDLLRARATEGCAVLVASHSPVLRRMADRVVQLADGQLVQ
jgi:putative ABC transport system ATP-binding protein